MKSSSSDFKDVREMYEYHPYPALGDSLKDFSMYANRLPKELKNQKINVLDAGCGTGHFTCSIAKQFPNANVIGIDLSSESLSIAKQLAALHNVENVKFFPLHLETILSKPGS